MNRTLFFLILVFCALLLTGIGCRKDDAARSIQPEGKHYARIISMAPNITETVFALGCGERVVGVADFSNYPPEAAQKQRAGGFINPNFERLLGLRPDIVIVQGAGVKLGKFCADNDIEFMAIDMNSIGTIYEGIAALGEKLGRPEQAERLCDDIRLQFKELADRLAGVERPGVFLCMGHTGGSLRDIYTAGPDSFLSELIGLAGGENIFGDIATGYPQVSKEALQKRRPGVIIEPLGRQGLTDAFLAQLRADWGRMGQLPAVKSGRLYFPTEDYLQIAGPRIAQAARRLAELIHPERFEKGD